MDCLDLYIMQILSRKVLLIFLILSPFLFVSGQEKVCLPEMLFNKKIKATARLSDGTVLQGHFKYLTPINDIKTTHVEYRGADKNDTLIKRMDFASYRIDGEDFYRYKVYLNWDKVMIKKECFIDLGKFLKARVDGYYKMLEDELISKSTIEAYSQSEDNKVYYLLMPDDRLIELNREDLKPQLFSLFGTRSECAGVLNKQSFGIQEVEELLQLVNDSSS